MNLALVEIAISNRVTTDTGAGGLWETDGSVKINAIGFDVMPAGITVPYVKCELLAESPDDTFEADGWFVDATFITTVRMDSERPTLAGAVISRLRERFSRWQPTIAGYNVTAFWCTGASTNHTDEERRYFNTYRLRAEEA